MNFLCWTVCLSVKILLVQSQIAVNSAPLSTLPNYQKLSNGSPNQSQASANASAQLHSATVDFSNNSHSTITTPKASGITENGAPVTRMGGQRSFLSSLSPVQFGLPDILPPISTTSAPSLFDTLKDSLNPTSLHISEESRSVSDHLTTVKRVLHDIVALIVNSLTMITSSLSVGTSKRETDVLNVKQNLENFANSYLVLMKIFSNDLVATNEVLNKIPGFGLIKFAIHVPVLFIEYIKNYLYKILVALGLSY